MAELSRPSTGRRAPALARAAGGSRPDRLGALLAVLTPLAFLGLLYLTIVDEAPTTWAAVALYVVLAALLCLRVGRRHTWLPFVLPALSLYLLFAVFPALNAFRVSLYAWSGFGEPTDYVGLANYASVVTSPVFWNALWHNVLIFLSIFVLQNVVGLFLAVLIHGRPRGYEFYRAAIFMPGIISLVASGLMWQVIFGSNIGLLTPLMQGVGLGALTRDWLGDSAVTFWLLVLVQFWQWMGLPMIIYLAGLQNVPEELIAAARIDGATDLQAFRHVTFPLLAPAFTVMTALCFIVMFKTFDIRFVMAGPGGAPNGTTDVLSLVIYRTAFGLGTTVRTSLQQGYAVAIGVVMSITLLFATTVQLAVLPLVLLDKKLGLINTYGGLIFPYVGGHTPFPVFMLTGFMRTLPSELRDAALIDGANEGQVFYKITVPLMRPALATVAILNTVSIWNDFFFPLVVSPKIKLLQVGVYNLIGVYSTEWGQIFAGVVLSALPIVVAYLLLTKQFVVGLSAGAIKG